MCMWAKEKTGKVRTGKVGLENAGMYGRDHLFVAERALKTGFSGRAEEILFWKKLSFGTVIKCKISC